MEARPGDIPIRIAAFDIELVAKPGTSLLATIRAAGIDVDADCAGRGTCGLCAVRFLDGAPPAGPGDAAALDATRLADGWRLACQAYAVGPCTVSLTPTTDRGAMSVLAHGDAAAAWRGQLRGAGWGAAIDVGTTTVVCYLIDRSRARQAGVAAFANPQRRFGDDVIARITYAHEGPEQLARLQSVLVDAIEDALAQLCDEHGIAADDLRAISVAGNPTMLHLLAGVDPWPLGVAPFEPAFRDVFSVPATSLGFSRCPANVEFLPLVAGHLGADAVAGIVALALTQRRGVSLFIDLGTNGEIALVRDGHAVGCTCAAGPAFEGGRISSGMPALPGAVRRVEIAGDMFALDVIGGGEARGLCGSGLTDAVALLLDAGAVSASGRMAMADALPDSVPASVRAVLRCGDGGPRIELAPGVALTARDVREVQLAKAAVRTGVDVLLEEARLAPEQVDDVFLAGAFGSSIRPESLLALGMLPAALRGRIHPVGNVAGIGAQLALEYEQCIDDARQLARTMRHVELMLRPDFEERFASNIAFPAAGGQ